uniref:tetratricopeptide repeat protein n=1 Tax=uncultured Sphingomonas sp. TaxID=158754 RepID=UPI0025E0277A|nr:hypothetical protein [uncultured Sphingomonas sp.]
MILALLASAALAQAACPAGPAGAACRAVAATKANQPAVAAVEFETAAAAASGPARDRALAAAGNMWIAAGQPGKAALALDRALAGTGLQAEGRGEALLDRARAAEAQNDLKLARRHVTQAAQTIGADPFLWYFSAALAIREGDAATAKTAIGRALSLAPNDALVLFEAGHVHHFAGEIDKARDYWRRAAAAEPTSPTGKAAAAALALLDKPAAPK